MSQTKLAAQSRSDFGKGAARRTRRAGRIPAVLYGHGTAPVHVSLPGHETFMALKHTNVLLEIELDGDSQLAIAKDIQRDPIRDTVDHVDLLLVRRGEKITVDVPVHVVGQSAPGTIHLLDLQTVSLEAEATHLPESVEVSVEGLEAGAHVLAGELRLAEGSTLVGDPDAIVLTVSVPQTAPVEEETDEVEADEAAPAAAASDDDEG